MDYQLIYKNINNLKKRVNFKNTKIENFDMNNIWSIDFLTTCFSNMEQFLRYLKKFDIIIDIQGELYIKDSDNNNVNILFSDSDLKPLCLQAHKNNGILEETNEFKKVCLDIFKFFIEKPEYLNELRNNNSLDPALSNYLTSYIKYQQQSLTPSEERDKKVIIDNIVDMLKRYENLRKLTDWIKRCNLGEIKIVISDNYGTSNEYEELKYRM